jgi:hypothetical protein
MVILPQIFMLYLAAKSVLARIELTHQAIVIGRSLRVFPRDSIDSWSKNQYGALAIVTNDGKVITLPAPAATVAQIEFIESALEHFCQQPICC